MRRDTKRFHLPVLGLLLAVVMSLGAASVGLCSPEYRAITILHTNDTHGHLLPFSYPEPLDPSDPTAGIQTRQDIGGIARRATLARRIEAEMRGAVLLLDAGDALDGTPFSVQYMGEADFAAMSAAGYDVMTCGNHEFSASQKEFMRNVSLASFPVLSANLVMRDTAQPVLPAYTIMAVDGVKLAIFGLTTRVDDGYRAVREGFAFLDPITTAKVLVPELRKQADIIIALTHIGSGEDLKLAREVPGIDLIVGGHSHTRLPQPLFVSRSEYRTDPFSVGGTIIVQDFQWGGELGRLDMRLRRNDGPFTLMSYSGKLLPVTSDIPDDPATAKVVAKYYEPMSKYYGEVIGEASDTFYSKDGTGVELLSLVCDAMREETGAQISIYNVGGIRSDLVRGTIKVWDIATVLPFRNKVVLLTLTGERLKKLVLDTRPGVSGMRYHIKDGQLVDISVGGRPVEDNATYQLATADFFASTWIKDIKPDKLVYEDYREPIINYIKAQKTISPVVDGRSVVE